MNFRENKKVGHIGKIGWGKGKLENYVIIF